MKLFSLGPAIRLPSAVRSVLDRKIVETASSLYAAQALNYVLPLVMIPYLARVLGPEVWGTVVFVQAIGIYLGLVVNYSFDLSATREVARRREDVTELSRLVAGVFGARLCLALASALVIAIAQLSIATLSEIGWLLWLGVFWFLAGAFRPFWFFLGLERVRSVLIMEVALKSLSVLGIVWLVNSPVDVWKVFAIQGTSSALATLAATVLVYRIVSLRKPTLSGIGTALRDGWHLFVLSVSTSIYAMSNTLILGFVAPAWSVGYYAGAERVSRALISMMYPIASAMFPRAASLAKDDPMAAARLARFSTFATFITFSAIAAILFPFVPVLVHIFLGPNFDETVPVLRTLLLLLPIIGISLPLGTHWIIPIGRERLLTIITFSAGIVHLPLATGLAFHFSHIGAAWAIVITEAGITLVMLMALISQDLGPFWFRPKRIARERKSYS